MTAQTGALRLDRIPSELGTILLVSDARGRVRALDFEDFEERMQRLLRLHYGALAESLTPGDAPQPIRTRLRDFFAGDIDALSGIEVATGGSEFQRRVWAALRAIPAGETRTYGQIAAAIERPAAVRAVGAANGANPVAIVVPCHRVIGADGSLTGYGGGLERKRWLLRHEGVAGFGSIS